MKYKTAIFESVTDLLNEIENCKTIDDSIKLLKINNNRSIKYFIDAYYNKDFTFMAGDIDHDYSREIAGLEYSNIYREKSRLETILKIGEKNKKTLRLCENLLEAIPAKDADLIKKYLFNGENLNINKKVFKAVYPDFFQ